MKIKLNKFEALSLTCIIMITQIILNIPEYLVDLTNSGTLINILYISIIGLIFCIIISNLIKNFPNFDIIDISEFLGGKFLKFVISIIFIVFLGVSLILAISNFSYLLKSIYFPKSTIFLILLLFIMSIVIANLKGFNGIKKITTIFIPGFIISILLLVLGTIDRFNIHNFFPVFGNDYSTTFVTGLQNIFSLNFIIIYFFLMPFLEKKNDFKKIVFSSYITNIFLLTFACSAIISFFPSPAKSLEKLNSINTIYLITRRIQISDFLTQTDALFVFIWIIAVLCYISLLVRVIIYILNKLFNFEDKNQIVFPISSIILGFCLIVNKINIIKFLEIQIFKPYAIILTFGICFFVLLFGYFKQKRKRLQP